jgi:anti-sigma factor RsiW
MECHTVRTMVHEDLADAVVQEHLQACAECARYAECFTRLDQALQSILVVPAPAAVSEQLRALPNGNMAVPRLDHTLRDELVTTAPPMLTERLLKLVPDRLAQPGRVDSAVRDALITQAPAQLTARLRALVPSQAIVSHARVVQPQPRRWVIGVVYTITAALLLIGLMFAGSLYQLILAQLGLEAWWADIAGLPAVLLNNLYVYVPQSRFVVGALVWLQQPLQWLLAALLLWAALDRTPSQTGRRYA